MTTPDVPPPRNPDPGYILILVVILVAVIAAMLLT